MMKQNQTALTASAGLGLKKKLGLAVGVALLGLSQQAFADLPYHDLNAGKKIQDLTIAGKAASTLQYGSTPTAVTDLGLGIVSEVSLPLNDPALWNSNYIVESTNVGGYSNSGLTYDPATGYGHNMVTTNVTLANGWRGGTTPNLGDTHNVDFYNFRLFQPAEVTISYDLSKKNSGTGLTTYYDSAFSLYRGVATYYGHDNAVDALQPTDDIGDRIQNPLDTGLPATADVQGIVGAARDTINTTYAGQFNALGNWSQSNISGNWSAIEYITSQNIKIGNKLSTAGGTVADVIETLTLLLQPGNYTIAAGGASAAGATSLVGHLNFTAAPVPLPSAVWLFMSAMFGVLGLTRRKSVALD